MKIFLIAWLDAASGDGWEELNETSPSEHLTYTIGFLVAETKNFYVLAATYDPDTKSTNARMSIPKGMVKEKREIKCKIKTKT
jgi:hypothetical protein